MRIMEALMVIPNWMRRSPKLPPLSELQPQIKERLANVTRHSEEIVTRCAEIRASRTQEIPPVAETVPPSA